jgi:hypothetical protein
MICDIQTSFESNSESHHLIDGSLHVDQVEDRQVTEIEVELSGTIA